MLSQKNDNSAPSLVNTVLLRQESAADIPAGKKKKPVKIYLVAACLTLVFAGLIALNLMNNSPDTIDIPDQPVPLATLGFIHDCDDQELCDCEDEDSTDPYEIFR